MIDIFFSALLGLARTVSAVIIAVLLASIIFESAAMGITLAVALAVFAYCQHKIRKIDDVSDVDTPPNGEENYHL